MGIAGFLTAMITAVVGYLLGAARAFREQKAKSYESILTPILRAAFTKPSENVRETATDIDDLNRAAVRLWLLAGKKAVAAADSALAGMVRRTKGKPVDVIPLLQNALAEARKDMHPWPWRHWEAIEPDDIAHFWFEATKPASQVNSE